jgi:hypothetical protein
MGRRSGIQSATSAGMPPEAQNLCQDRVINLSEVANLLQKRVDAIDSWLSEIGSSCKVEQRHCEEGTVERAYWHYGYMVALRDALDLLKRNAQLLS